MSQLLRAAILQEIIKQRPDLMQKAPMIADHLASLPYASSVLTSGEFVGGYINERYPK